MEIPPRVVFMGTPDFAVAPLAALLKAGFDVVGVLTREDNVAGRGRRLEESPVKQFARAEELLIQQPRTLRTADALGALKALQPDLIVVAAYGLILPPALLELPPRGCLNIHGSLLPRHRGAAPIAAAILAGEPETGVSIMLMDAGIDTGPVLSQSSLPIRADDTTGSLTERLANLGAELLIRTLPGWIEGTVKPLAQANQGASYAPRIEKRDGQIRWEEPAELIARRVRAYQPWPSAFTSWRGQILKVVRATASAIEPQEAESSGTQGTVVADEANRAGVICGEGLLWLEEVQLAGKRALPIESFLRGAPGLVGSRLE